VFGGERLFGAELRKNVIETRKRNVRASRLARLAMSIEQLTESPYTISSLCGAPCVFRRKCEWQEAS
ncbi:MAG: hypothetical protein ACK5TH_19790, partial [Prosthecobacter sp.]